MAYSIPKDHHPAYDATGEFCGEKQKNPVWFFPGTFVSNYRYFIIR